ncbi:hypothetical protein ACFVWT_18535 [Arthrobacter sp. NPDC058288]|uniref:hypothetical protein n=1 Tax=Arthrobacter sp. NPDC058288 TaxID=3346424 RepID=UPI0036E17F74
MDSTLEKLRNDPYISDMNAIQGPTLDERMDQARINDAWYQDGLEDAQRNVYDVHSFAKDRALVTELKAWTTLQEDSGAALNRQRRDEQSAADIISSIHASAAMAASAYEAGREHSFKAGKHAEEGLAALTNPASPAYVEGADRKTDPNSSEAGLKPKWWQSIGALIVLGLLVECALAVWSFQVLGEDMGITSSLAITVALVSVFIPIYAGRVFRDPSADKTKRSAAWASLGFLALVILGAAWMRYVKMEPKVALKLSADAEGNDIVVQTPTIQVDGSPTAPVETAPQLSGWVIAILFVFSIAVPLAMSMIILLAELSDKTSALADVRYRRIQAAIAQAELDELTAINVKAQRKAAVAHHNLEVIREATENYLRTLPALVAQNYLSRISGMARGMANPAVTSCLEECSEAFLERFQLKAEKLVEEQLGFLRPTYEMPDPLRIWVDDDGFTRVKTPASQSPREETDHA